MEEEVDRMNHLEDLDFVVLDEFTYEWSYNFGDLMEIERILR